MHGLIDGTPIEKHNGIWVKREDLCCPAPGPSFSKMRGVLEHLEKRPEKVVGVLDTFHSMAGWAVSYACSKLGKQCVDFYPVYKAAEKGELRENQLTAQSMGAKLIGLTAGRSAILYHRARKTLAERWPGAYLMPNALKLEESITATAYEVQASRTQLRRIKPAHVVVSISSGTIAAGVLLGFHQLGLAPQFWLHEGYSRSASAVKAYLLKMALEAAELIEAAVVVDEKYAYKDKARGVVVPFPCNEYYDQKAIKWLLTNRADLEGDLEGSVLFWNIGS